AKFRENGIAYSVRILVNTQAIVKITNAMKILSTLAALVLIGSTSFAQTTQPLAEPARGRARGVGTIQAGPINLADIRMRDVCILADDATRTYYMIGPGGRGIRQYTSKDMITWNGPRMIYTSPADVWGD